MRKSLDAASQSKLIAAIQKKLNPLGWSSVALLLLTGMFQMSANPNYEGILAISGQWAWAILVKHLFFLGVIAVNAAQTWWVLPSLQRAMIRQKKSGDMAEAARLQKREKLLLNSNLVLAILALGMTALARAT